MIGTKLIAAIVIVGTFLVIAAGIKVAGIVGIALPTAVFLAVDHSVNRYNPSQLSFDIECVRKSSEVTAKEPAEVGLHMQSRGSIPSDDQHGK